MHKKILAFYLILFILFIFLPIEKVLAGAGENVSGFAWSENIGWMSFNNTSGGGGTNYGVNIAADGTLSGYVWSENIGWISFNRSDTGTPPASPYNGAESYIAKVDLSSKEASGWARVLANGGGWDGWLKLRGSNYGVWLDDSVNPVEFRGWAWSDMVLGWVSFNCADRSVCGTSNYKVITGFSFNYPPSAVNLVATSGDYCEAPYPPIFLSWTFSDPDPGDTQSAYQLQIDNNSNFSSPEIDTGQVFSSSNSYAPMNLSYNATYYWRVKVWDQKPVASNWATGNQFSTAQNHYPSVDFSWTPEKPAVNEQTSFNDETTFYVGGNKTFIWTFQDGSPSNASQQNPLVKFSSQGEKQITLQATDSRGYSCSASKTLNTQIPLPDWREIIPFSKVWNFIVGIPEMAKGFFQNITLSLSRS